MRHDSSLRSRARRGQSSRTPTIGSKKKAVASRKIKTAERLFILEVRVDWIEGLLAKQASHEKSEREVGKDFTKKKLSGRQWQIFSLLGETTNYKEVARQLKIKVQTVRNHVGSIMHKLGVSSRAELIALRLAQRKKGRTTG